MKKNILYLLVITHIGIAQTKQWVPLGPFFNPTDLNGSVAVPSQSIGRIDDLEFDPSDPTNNTIYAASASGGGLWRTTDAGANWCNANTNTDFFDISGVGDIEIATNNGNVIYVATSSKNGDGGAKGFWGTGIYRTDNRGVSWTKTLNIPFTDHDRIQSIAVHPSTKNGILPSEMAIAVSQNGTIYRTYDGTNWSVVYTNSSENFNRVLFDVNNPGNIYVSGKEIYKSTNLGTSWTKDATYNTAINSGTCGNTHNYCNNAPGTFTAPTTSFSVSQITYSRNGGGANNGILYAYSYITDNASPAVSWLKVMSYTNGGWTCKFATSDPCEMDKGPHLSFDVSPANSLLIAKTNVNTDNSPFYSNIRVSYDGGINWTEYSNGYNAFDYNNKLHPDNNVFRFHPTNASNLFIGNDGGVFQMTGFSNTITTSPTYSRLNNGLTIGTQWAMSGSFDAKYIAVGNQDDGVNEFNASMSSWKFRKDGDGGAVAYDKDDSRYLLTLDVDKDINHNDRYSIYKFSALTNAFRNVISSQFSYSSDVLKQDPNNSDVFYVGAQELYTSASKGSASYTQISNFQSQFNKNPYQHVTNIAFDNISGHKYVAVHNLNPAKTQLPSSLARVFKLPSGGIWTPVTPPSSATDDENITGIACNGQTNSVWAVYNSANANLKVKKSSDGGNTWSDYNTGLPNLPIYCITFKEGSDDMVFIGTQAGIYYRSALMSQWTKWTTLPNVRVNKIEFNVLENSIRAATYGRGLWIARADNCPDVASMNVSTSSYAVPGSTTTYKNYFEAAILTSDAAMPTAVTKVDFKACNYVKLLPGFSAKQGQTYKASILGPNASTFSYTLPACISPSSYAVSDFPNLTMLPLISGPTNGNYCSNYSWSITQASINAYGSDLSNTTFEWFFNYPTDQTVKSTSTSMSINSSVYQITQGNNPTLVFSVLCRATTAGKTSNFSPTSYITLSQGGCGSKLAPNDSILVEDSTTVKSNNQVFVSNSTTTSPIVFKNNKHSTISPTKATVSEQDTIAHIQEVQQAPPVFPDNIYPNPTQGQLYIQKHLEENETYDVAIYDVNGKQILSKNKVSTGNYELDLTGKPLGSYFLKLTDKKGSKEYKIILDDYSPVLYNEKNFIIPVTSSTKKSKKTKKR